MRRITRYLAAILVALTIIAPVQASSFGDSLRGLGESLGLTGGQPDFLEPDQAFIYSADVVDGHTLRARFEIVDEYYLYKDKFEFAILDAEGITIASSQGSPGKEKDDEFFGLMEVYYQQAEFIINLERQNLAKTPLVLKATYQGCADAGLCYPPISNTLPLTLPMVTSPAASTPVAPGDSAPQLSEQDQLAQSLASGSTWLTMLTFFGLGLLLAFTPCVFPMIPILSSIIVGQGEHITTRRAFTLSLVYVLAMALTYTVAGVLAGLFGQNLQIIFQDPWILGSFAVMFVALALSMFGFYEIQLPSRLQSRLTQMSNSQQGGTLAGTAIMGLLSALIVGPCVAPPLAGALIYIGQSGDALLGGLALFALSMGMGAPLLAIGTSAGKVLPRTGDWMNAIKGVFGVLLLAVAIWMLERIIPAALTLGLWAMLLIGSSIYLGALEPLGAGATGWRKLWKGLGLAMLIYGSLLLIGAASGAKDPLQPLQGISFAASGQAQKQELHFTRIKSVEELEQQLATARASGQPVMLDFYADWCVSCKEMERYTFSDPQVQQALAGYKLLQADVTTNDDQDQALLRKFNLFGPPAIIFYDSQAEEQRHLQLVGFMAADAFRQHIRSAR